MEAKLQEAMSLAHRRGAKDVSFHCEPGKGDWSCTITGPLAGQEDMPIVRTMGNSPAEALDNLLILAGGAD